MLDAAAPSRSFVLASLGALLVVAAACKKDLPASESPSQARSADEGDESITNTQVQGVNEGGIVKTHGDHLVVLRRGRLFSVQLRDGALRPISYVDTTPHPGHDSWYDEMLIHGDTVVVVGYSYRVRATEIGLFHIDERGTLSYRDTWFLSSGDYYSSRNYASRLIGDSLAFYMPCAVGGDVAQADGPELARWKGGDRRTRKHADWARLIEQAEIVPSLDASTDQVLHTVVTCDLGEASLGCRARGVLGGYGRSFYASSRAFYVWTDDGSFVDDATLYRLPLGDGPIGSVHVSGMPIDQFSFHETADDHLAVVVSSDGHGDAMWSAEQPATALGLLRLPLAALETRGQHAPPSAYRTLPGVGAEPFGVHNRFVGDALLYGSGSGWWSEPQSTPGTTLYVHHLADPAGRTDAIALPHAVERIEALGRDALVVGGGAQALYLTSIALGEQPTIASQYVQPGAAQGELRSHGFFFRGTGERDGMLGLPLRRWDTTGVERLWLGSAGVAFLRVDDLRLSPVGELASAPLAGTRDACITSCMDWYGNARPIFYRGRIFALLGYELVEGEVVDGSLRERQRVDLSTMIGGTGLRHAG